MNNQKGTAQIEESLRQKVVEKDMDFFAKNHISAKYAGNFCQLKYTSLAQAFGFNEFSELCRGRIYHNGTLVALPFRKFFNYGERDKFPTNSKIKYVMEKMDGSLAIVWYFNGKWRINTQGGIKGGFDRQNIMENALDNIDTSCLDISKTYLFEFVGKDNQHVVRYNFDKKLVYLASVEISTGNTEWFFQNNPGNFPTPKLYEYDLNTIQHLLTELPKDDEGFVAIFEDNSIWKFKGKEYLKYHKFLFRVTKQSLIKFVLAQPTPKTKEEIKAKEHAYLASIPEEFHEDIFGWIDEIWTQTEKGNTFDVIVQEVYEQFHKPTTQDIVGFVKEKYGQQWIGLVVTYIQKSHIPYYQFAKDEI